MQQNIGSNLYRITQPMNGDTTNLYAVELTLVRQLDFLPKALHGFTTYANYTPVHADVTLPRGKSILPGQASNMGNASMSWERHGSPRASRSTVRACTFTRSATRPPTNNWLDHRLGIDLGNEPYRAYVGDANHAIQEERYKI